MSWVQQNLEWLVGFLIVGIIVLFFFPLLLGWQLNKEEEKMISGNGSLQIISILVLAFSMLLITEVFKLKKVQRRLVRKIDIMKKELTILKKKRELVF